jgi:glutamate/aspartate transport system substrate-binding protein
LPQIRRTSPGIRAPRSFCATHRGKDLPVKRILCGLLVLAGLAAFGAAAQTAPDTLARIKAAKAINVAYSPDSLPFSWATSDRRPAGYSIDLCKRVIARIARTVGEPDLKVNWTPGSVVERVQMVASGKADLECGNTTQTQARLAQVDFSSLIFVDSGGFLVKTDSTIHRIADMGGKRIAVLKGTTTEARLAQQLQARLVNATLVPIGEALEGIAMLDAGTVDAYAGDKIKLIGVAAQVKDPARFSMLIEELSFEPYAFALPRNDSAFRREVNTALTQVYLSPEIEVIFEQWLGRLGRPSGLLAAMFLLNAIPE